MPRRSAAPLLLTLLLVGLAGLAALDLAPHPLRKEGPVEHLSHAALALAALGWLAAARSGPSGRGQLVAAGLAATSLLLLGEEVDYGGTYGFDAGADALRALTGRPTLHTAFDGRLYPFFVLPLLAWFFGAGLWRALAPEPARRWLGHAPRPADALAFAAAFTALALTQLLPIDPHDRFEEGAELALYLTVLLAAQGARSESGRSGARGP